MSAGWKGYVEESSALTPAQIRLRRICGKIKNASAFFILRRQGGTTCTFGPYLVKGRYSGWNQARVPRNYWGLDG